MFNELDVETILWKEDNHSIFLKIMDVYETNEDDYYYEIAMWNDRKKAWIEAGTQPEGYLTALYEVPDRLTLLVKFGVGE